MASSFSATTVSGLKPRRRGSGCPSNAVLEALANGGRHVHRVWIGHDRASRYGPTTRSTRHTLANTSISPGFARRRSSARRRASTATSVPIVLRNLKQSATLFAGRVDRNRNTVDGVPIDPRAVARLRESKPTNGRPVDPRNIDLTGNCDIDLMRNLRCDVVICQRRDQANNAFRNT